MATVQANAGSVERAAANPGLELLERLGYAVRGVLYVVMGALALRLAFSQAAHAFDLTGSLVFVIGNQYGRLVLLCAVVGLAAYSVWGLVRAIFDPMHRGSDPSGYLARLGFLTSAVSYGLVVAFGLEVLAGTGDASGDATQRSVAALLDHPAGGALTLGLGLVAVGIGVGQLMEAYRAVFKRDLKGAEMTKTMRDIVIALGRFGMFARGVVFLVVGWFIVQAGLHHDPGQVQGFGGAFMFLGSRPFGHLVLGVVALGIVALGLHSLACARWVRLMGSERAA